MIPYYFIAVHNEPYHLPDGEKRIERNYEILSEMVSRADDYSIKLTLMFSAQWAEYISSSSDRVKTLQLWKDRGHEIAAHHHTIYHHNWDGYTDYGLDYIREQRLKFGKEPEPFLGNFEKYIKIMKKINPDIKSGGMNDEEDKQEIPDEVIYDTCSGFVNIGEGGRRIKDLPTAEHGINEFITVGTLNNTVKKFLVHYTLFTQDNLIEAQKTIRSLKSGVYGVVTHSISRQAKHFYTFLETLHDMDPDGEKSKTVTEIIEQKLIPEKILPDDILCRRYHGETIY
jgi:hypothetical protein